MVSSDQSTERASERMGWIMGSVRSPKEKEAATTHIRLRNVHRSPLQIRPPVRARIEPLAERDGRRRLAREVCDLEGVGREEGFCVRLRGVVGVGVR